MKKIAIAIVATAALIGAPAFAADMAVKMPVKAPPPAPAPIYTWTGCYIGGNLGGGWASTGWANPEGRPPATAVTSVSTGSLEAAKPVATINSQGRRHPRNV